MLLEVLLVLIEHAVQPGEELLSAVVGVQDHRDAVRRGNAADVIGSGDGTDDGGELVGVGDALWWDVSDQRGERRGR